MVPTDQPNGDGRFRNAPVLEDMVFREPAGGWFARAFLAFSLVLGAWMLVDRGPKVAVLAAGPLLLLATADMLPASRHRLSVVVRIGGFVWFVALWIAILVFFPDAPAFFEGGW